MPTPTDIRNARLDAGLTQRQAAELVYVTERQWRNYESNASTAMPMGYWELFRIKTKGVVAVR